MLDRPWAGLEIPAHAYNVAMFAISVAPSVGEGPPYSGQIVWQKEDSFTRISVLFSTTCTTYRNHVCIPEAIWHSILIPELD